MVEDADGRHRRLVARNRCGESTGAPTWSPDGRRLACRAAYLSSGCEHYTAFDVYVIGVDGSDKRRVTPTAGFPQCPAWSSDARLAFYATEDDPCHCKELRPEARVGDRGHRQLRAGLARYLAEHDPGVTRYQRELRRRRPE